VLESGAALGYTQSDEISLTWHSTDIRSQIYFNGRISKMTSQLAAQATLSFYRAVLAIMPEYADRQPTFDARVWQVPTRQEAANVFIWREWDATKNSLSMAASAYFSHNQLHGKNGADKHEMLFQKGINWADYPAAFKRGTYVRRVTVERALRPDELEALPAKHNARQNPDLLVQRTELQEVCFPVLASIANLPDVIFDGAEPVAKVPA
jgi:tRNA(His) 5'-end guanylyltransferase